MSATADLLARRTTLCSSCGAPFACGAGTGASAQRCWCQDLPTLSDLDPDADCLCRQCLDAKIALLRKTGPQ